MPFRYPVNTACTNQKSSSKHHEIRRKSISLIRCHVMLYLKYHVTRALFSDESSQAGFSSIDEKLH
jgi:hypothetical protein